MDYNLLFKKHSIKAKDLKARLANIPDDAAVVFAVDGIAIHFHRFKERGHNLVQMEFNETEDLLRSAVVPDTK